MKKMINDPFKVTDELVEGFVRANPDKARRVEGMNVVVRKDAPIKNKVGVVIGGGSGHEPLFLEMVGKGMGDAVAHGAIFTSPSPDLIYEAVRQVNGGAGIVFVYGNYMGDRLNFDMAAEMAQADGIEVRTIRVWDDIASAPLDRISERRGTAADLFVIKATGAKAETMANLDEVERAARKVRDNCRSMGVALTSCTIPATGKETFTIAEDEMEIGMGAHGEPGVLRTKLKPADEIAQILTERIIQDLSLKDSDEINVLVNGFGSTTRMEMLILYRKADMILREKGIKVYDAVIGNFLTTQEMAGASFTFLKLDDEIKELWDASASSPGFSRCSK